MDYVVGMTEVSSLTTDEREAADWLREGPVCRDGLCQFWAGVLTSSVFSTATSLNGHVFQMVVYSLH